MLKTQVYLPEDDSKALWKIAQRWGRSVADLVRNAIRQVWLRPGSVSASPMTLWDGISSRTSVEHDVIYNERYNLFKS